MAVIRFRIVEVSSNVEAKINGKHHVSTDDVLEALANQPQARWETDAAGMTRVIVKGTTDSGRILGLFLYPIPDRSDEWRLATAYPLISP